MTGNAVGGTLMLLGFIAVVTIVLLAFGKLFLIGLDAIITKWRRLGMVSRVVAVMMAAVATVEAQKSGMGDSNRVERVDRVDGGGGDFSRKEHKESVGVDGEVLKLGVEVEQMTDKPSAVLLGLETSNITSTYRLASVKTNDSYSYSMPENAVRYPNWWIRGGYEDVFKLGLGDFRFPLGTNIVDYLWVYTWGKVRPQLKAKELEIAAVGAPMSAVPQVSEFWYADGANGSKILTWHNFFLGRVPISELDGGESDFSRVERVDRVEGDELDFNTETQRHGETQGSGDKISEVLPQSSNTLREETDAEINSSQISSVPLSLCVKNNTVVPISAQLELFPNGDYIARSNLVERYFKRINPDDFDDDGIPDGVDENPELSDGDFFGPDNDLPEGANSNNYCWVDVVVSNANSLVTFIGDRPSNLPDPHFIAKPCVTNRVTLLIGKTYRVTSAQPIICTEKSNDDIIIDVHDSHSMTICYPVSYEIVDMARSVSRQIRMIPPSVVGTFNWNTNTCCTQVQTSPSELPKCAWDCACDGCTLGGFTFDYEGYSLNFGGIGCGCSVGEGEGSDDNQDGASVSVSFSHKVLFYEEAYTNAPGDVVARRHSTNVTVRVEVYGGEHGGLLNLTQAGFDKLSFVGGDVIPQGSVMIGERERRIWEAEYAPFVHSDEKDDVVVETRFSEYTTGDVLEDDEKLTVIKLELVPSVTRDGCEWRHIVGVREAINCFAMPDVGDWEESGGGYFRGRGLYRAPLMLDGSTLSYVVDEWRYIFNLIVIEPSAVVACSPKACDFSLNENVSGGAGMELELYILPEEVSFTGISMEEVPSLEGVHVGYFANISFMNVWYHTVDRGAGQWVNIKPDNYWATDSAVMGDVLPLEKPNGDITWDLSEGVWSQGELVWYIPWGWRERDAEIGEEPVKVIPVRYNQTFRIDQHGTLSVLKFGHVVSRGTNNVIKLNGNIVPKASLVQGGGQ